MSNSYFEVLTVKSLVSPCGGKWGGLEVNAVDTVLFWNRLIKMDDTRLPKRIFLQDCKQANSNWSQDIREVFKILNLTSVYDSKVPVNVRNVKSQLRTIIDKEWKLELESKLKLFIWGFTSLSTLYRSYHNG